MVDGGDGWVVVFFLVVVFFGGRNVKTNIYHWKACA